MRAPTSAAPTAGTTASWLPLNDSFSGSDYDIDHHLGGVRYVFCRGLDRDDASHPGVHALRLPSDVILAIDALMRPGSVPT